MIVNYRVTEMTLSRRGREHKHDYYVYQGRFVGERNLLDKNDFVCFLLPKILQYFETSMKRSFDEMKGSINLMQTLKTNCSKFLISLSVGPIRL